MHCDTCCSCLNHICAATQDADVYSKQPPFERSYSVWPRLNCGLGATGIDLAPLRPAHFNVVFLSFNRASSCQRCLASHIAHSYLGVLCCLSSLQECTRQTKQLIVIIIETRPTAFRSSSSYVALVVRFPLNAGGSYLPTGRFRALASARSYLPTSTYLPDMIYNTFSCIDMHMQDICKRYTSCTVLTGEKARDNISMLATQVICQGVGVLKSSRWYTALARR